MKVALLMPDNEPQPEFAPGDNVIIFDPRVKYEDLMFDGIDAPKHATIKRSAFVEHLGIFAYELNEFAGWYNEAWLHEDEYLPLLVSVEKPGQRKARAEQVDNLLDRRSWYAKSEVADKDERIAEIDAELRKVCETK